MAQDLETRVPAELLPKLQAVRADLLARAGPNLIALILYGGLARGRYRPGRSDVNLLLLLQDTSSQALDAIAPALQTAWRTAQVEPLLLGRDELESCAAAFPVKFLDIKDHHILLHGSDPFTNLIVSREHIRLRIEQQLRNLCLRLRRRYIAFAKSPAGLVNVLAEVARSLALALAALLKLAGREVPEEDRTAAIFSAAASAFELDHEALAQLAAIRDTTSTTVDAPALYGRVLATVVQAAALAARMKDPSP
jgi:predicted nucleotidyltransferase